MIPGKCISCSLLLSSRWYKNGTICASCDKKEWYSKNKEKALSQSKIWHDNNLEKVIAIKASWFQDNKQDVYLKRNIKRKDNINFRISCNLRSRLANAIRSNSKVGSAVNDLGCSIEELKIKLEKQFTEGMTWDNYGKGENKWNIDHIIPLCSFNLSIEEELSRACNFNNLRPLWEKDNLRKAIDDKRKSYKNCDE